MVRKVTVQVDADLRPLRARLGEASRGLKKFAGEFNQAAKSGHLDNITRGATVMGASMVGAFGLMVKSAADFDKAMSGVSAATHAGSQDMSALRGAALQAGKDTSYSATQAADAITELSKAGVHVSEVLNGGLKGALSLAAAGQMDVGQAAEIAASAMTQFGLGGEKVGHIADLLAAGAGQAQGSVGDLGYALSQGGLVAHQFGLSVEDTTGLLAEFASAGLMGSDAGTSMKTMLLALPHPTQQAQAEMKRLNIDFYDAQGNFVGVSKMAGILQDRMKGLTDKQRQAALSTIFGNDAIRAASILYEDGAKGVDKWKGGVNKAGYATDAAARQTDNLAGDIERLKGSFETMAIEAGTGANSALRVLTKTANGALDVFSSLPAGVQATATVVAGLGGAALLGMAGFVKIRGGIKDFMAEVEGMGSIGTKVAGKLKGIASVGGKFGLIGVGATAAWVGLNALSNWAEKRHAPTKANIDSLAESLQTFAATGQVTGELAAKYGQNLEKIGQSVDKVVSQTKLAAEQLKYAQENATDLSNNFDSGVQQVDPQSIQSIKDLDAALTQLASNGGATQARVLLQKLRAGAHLTAEQYQHITDMMPGYTAAMRTAAGANTGLAKGFGTAQTKAVSLKDSLEDAIQSGQKLTDVWNQLNGAFLNSDKAALAVNEAIKNVSKSFKENGKSVDGNSTKALKNRIAVGEVAKAAADAAQAKYEETGSIEQADKTYTSYIGQLKKTLGQAHLTDKQVKTLIGRYANMPKSVVTDVHLNNADEAKVEAKLRHLSSMQQALKSADTIDRFHGGYSSGGWTGPGPRTMPAGIVHADEFVLSKPARGSLEGQRPGALNYMNRTGKWPSVGDGPGDAWPFAVNVSKTKIPPSPFLLGGGTGPGGGPTDRWILGVVRGAFPGLHATSTFRAGAVTLSGNRSYHAFHRAVDFPPSKALAEWVNANYGHATRELITPWNSLNIKNGARHTYTGEVFAQHAGTGRFRGNAHDHWAMANGGVIPEHVIGVGRSGRTYEFGERGPERVTPIPGYSSGGYVQVLPSDATRSTPGKFVASATRLDVASALLSARDAVTQLSAALKQNGRSFSYATQKGRDNRRQLLDGIEAAQSAAKAKYNETGSIRAANKVYDEYIRRLDLSMKKMHVNARTRHALIKAYSERPKYDLPDPVLTPIAPSNSSGRIKSVQDYAGAEEALANTKTAFAWTKPTFSARTETGRAELQTLFTYLGAAEQAAQSQYAETGNAKSATALYNGYLSQLRTILTQSGMSKATIDTLFKQYGRITLTKNRWGGVYEHAAGGSLREAQMASGAATRYAWAEPSTGGELFAPKHGNLSKTRREVGWAVANWWGGHVNWTPGAATANGAARTVVIDATIPITLGSESISRQVRLELDTAIGKVTSAIIHA